MKTAVPGPSQGTSGDLRDGGERGRRWRAVIAELGGDNVTAQTLQHRDLVMNDCIDNCNRCAAACLETINYCLGKGGGHADAQHIAMMAACADMCATSAATMLRGANVQQAICSACAAVCRQCAAACDGFVGDAEMKRCADACRRCAQSCAAMARR